MAPTTLTFTREELVKRRAELISRLDISLDEFRDRMAEGTLSGQEWYIAEDLNEIDFLLGDA